MARDDVIARLCWCLAGEAANEAKKKNFYMKSPKISAIDLMSQQIENVHKRASSVSRRLILLGGPPGVGKTTVLRHLEELIPGAALLDADDVRNTAANFDEDPAVVLQTVVAVMRDRLMVAGINTGLLAWVFARKELYQPVISGLEDLVDAIDIVYLLADEKTLARRLMKRGDPGKLEYARSRLALIAALPYHKIDTSGLTSEQVAARLTELIFRDRVS